MAPPRWRTRRDRQHASDALPLLRRARGDGVLLWRRGPYRAAAGAGEALRRRVGRLRLHAQESKRRALRALEPCAWLPTLVQHGPAHREPRDSRRLQDRRTQADREQIGAMTSQPYRLPQGGRIDRSRPIQFTFNDRSYGGYLGDTLASALLANGVTLVGRSFKYHRPRGIMSAGPEEPNALVQLAGGAYTEPNIRATVAELYEGLSAYSQNCWPSVELDLGSVNSLLSRLFPAGFYYKTFMWPPSLWMTYERFIRRMAGLGMAPVAPDPDHYDKTHAHCDVLVIGGGPAGLAAALAAGRSGARVVLCDEQAEFGGALLGAPDSIDGRFSADWIADALAALAAMPEVRLLPRTTAFGYYDHNYVGLVERAGDHLPPGQAFYKQRLWKLRAAQVVLATGALERPLVFADNDRPGTMLAAAARTYLNRYAVLPGKRALVVANNDTAYAAAIDLANAGVSIAAVVDLRWSPTGALATEARRKNFEILDGHAITATHGRRRVTGAT